MSKPWFRLYAEFLSDPKMQLLAFEDQRHYVGVLCLKCNGTLETLSIGPDHFERMVSKALGLDPATGAEVKRRLMDVGLISESWQPVAWNKRQYESDSSAARTFRYREKRLSNGMSQSWDGASFLPKLQIRDGGMACCYCGSTESLCVDHMVPIAKGGNDDLDNLAVACKRCNSGKAGRTPVEAGLVFVSRTAQLAHENYLSRSVTVTVTDKNRSDSEQIQNRTEQTPTARKRAKLSDEPEGFAEFRKIFPPRAGSQPWSRAQRAWNARVGEGVTPAELIAGAQRYAAYVEATGKARTETVLQAATFLGPDKHFQNQYPLPAQKETAWEEIQRLNGGNHASAGRVFDAEPSPAGLVSLLRPVRS